jgi:hypothetical protein
MLKAYPKWATNRAKLLHLASLPCYPRQETGNPPWRSPVQRRLALLAAAARLDAYSLCDSGYGVADACFVND